MKKYIVDTKYGNYVIEAENEHAAATEGYKRSVKDAVSVEQFRRITELMKCIRADIAAEFETINDYETHAALAVDLGYEKVANLLNSIRNEERAHVGELMSALAEIDCNDGKHFNSGVDEANEILNNAAEGASPEETKAVDESVEDITIESIISETGADGVAAGTFNGEEVIFLSFNSQDKMIAARDTLNQKGIEILQSTLNPLASLYMITIKKIGE